MNLDDVQTYLTKRAHLEGNDVLIEWLNNGFEEIRMRNGAVEGA